MLNVNEIEDVFKETVGVTEDLDEIFKNIDHDNDGLINYSEFLAATVDKSKTLSY
jgi:Ca2+-binding EF-hand superfamily protein